MDGEERIVHRDARAAAATEGGSGVPVLRMASLLRSWLLLAALWGVGQLLLGLLVLRQIELTAAALWTTALVSACQALALESLEAPLGFGLFLTQAAGSLRRRTVWILWLLDGAAVATAHLLERGGALLLSALGALLAVLAAGLFTFAAWRPEGLRSARPALSSLSLLLLLSAAEAIRPWLSLLSAWLLPQWPKSPARSLLVALFVVALYSALFRSQRRIAGRDDTASGWLAAAAGAGALGVVASLLPLRLMTSLQEAPSLGPGTLLVAVTGCLATAGICLLPASESESR